MNFQFGYELTGLRRYQSLWYAGASVLAALWTLMPLRDIFGRLSFIGVPVGAGALGLALPVDTGLH